MSRYGIKINEDKDFDFHVTCKKCKSDKVVFENDLGYLPESGGWGSARLVCLECKTETALVEGLMDI